MLNIALLAVSMSLMGAIGARLAMIHYNYMVRCAESYMMWWIPYDLHYSSEESK